MSNHTPPCACLADFGFMTMVLDPVYPMSCSAQLEGGTLMFMSPELLMPTVLGMKDGVPTPEADIYAFGLVIFQVCKLDWRIDRFILLCPGPYGRTPVPWHSTNGVSICCDPRTAPEETRKCLVHRPSWLAVGFRPTLLGWRHEIATEGH